MTLVQSTAMAVLLSVFLTACGGGGGGSTTTTTGSNTTDTDGDGVIDSLDAFPNNKDETKDSDGDGVGDNADAFPNNKDETKDSDGDSVGDNADAFPYNPNRSFFQISGRITGMTGQLSISINGNTKLYYSDDTFEFKLAKDVDFTMTLKANYSVCSSTTVKGVIVEDISDIKVTCLLDSDGDGTIDTNDAFPHDSTRFKVENDAHSYKPKFDAGFSDIVNLNDNGNTDTENVENIARFANEAYDNTVTKIITVIAKKLSSEPSSSLENAVEIWDSQLDRTFDYNDAGMTYKFSIDKYKDGDFTVIIRGYKELSSEYFKKKILETDNDKLEAFSYKEGIVSKDSLIRVDGNKDGSVSFSWTMWHSLSYLTVEMRNSPQTASYSVTSLGRNLAPKGRVEFNKNDDELKFRNDSWDTGVKAHYNQNKDILEWIK
ncbi:thrombospondin type 3 repeat-containing protein [Moritella sp. 28]|uniref:thrombospondin type 3 repeat-containing protein n=1 Tax=Moritella sp. 28 TaxID=2746232 RepID=UPI001BA5204B|nr:thrombospondin type 3 repeat-containing protein [Moritella sp. 28]QUM85496.1 thrombospondin type 3 repeat-containing protein [Moritella sp. 28]